MDRDLFGEDLEESTFAVRMATRDDIERIAALCEQLGYPTSKQRAQQRLEGILDQPGHRVLVAEIPEGDIAGWVHIFVRPLVITDLHAEIGGLVVDEAYRRSGVGRLLMRSAEDWARNQECKNVRLRSRIQRKLAHAFYERIGYTTTKTSLNFVKTI
jgi:ribosomal protein S18 acetylase RimI-like enzyme